MLKKSLIGLVVITVLSGGSYWWYQAYQAKVEADRVKVAEAIAKLVIEQQKEQVKEYKKQQVEREQRSEFAKIHYPKVLNGTGTIEIKVFTDEKGVKRAEYQLVDGNIGGKYTLWYEDGTKQEEGFLLEAKGYKLTSSPYSPFISPIYFGEQHMFSRSGNLKEQSFYNDSGSFQKSQRFYENGAKQHLYIPNKTTLLGESTWWYKNGQMLERSTQNTFGSHGWAEYWYASGVKKCEGEFESDGLWQHDRVGVWKKWDEAGNLVAEGFFSDNKVDKSKPYLGTEDEIRYCSSKYLEK